MSNANFCHEEDAVDAEEPEDLELDDELLSLSGDEDYDDEELQSLDSFYSAINTKLNSGHHSESSWDQSILLLPPSSPLCHHFPISWLPFTSCRRD
ncbi:GM21548 [Drosophila sechellia]|uniref:GM21548 n=1 Tax=Drosophila sechellia TaxID=7238 RepID=B4HRD6_DROSE|nr:GM21548 [Drosophila sechellia]